MTSSRAADPGPPGPAAATRVPASVYRRIGGHAVFDAIGRRLFDEIRADPVLRPLYPSDPERFDQVRWRFTAFLEQYWGGPRRYAAHRGDPRLVLRHRSVRIGPAERDAWLAAARRALDSVPLPAPHRDTVMGHLADVAARLVTDRP